MRALRLGQPSGPDGPGEDPKRVPRLSGEAGQGPNPATVSVAQMNVPPSNIPCRQDSCLTALWGIGAETSPLRIYYKMEVSEPVLLAQPGVFLSTDSCTGDIDPWLQWQGLELRLGLISICYGREAGEPILLAQMHASPSSFLRWWDSYPTVAGGARPDTSPLWDLLWDRAWWAHQEDSDSGAAIYGWVSVWDLVGAVLGWDLSWQGWNWATG